MAKPSYNISVSVDERTGRLLAAYLRVREGQVAETREVKEGTALADYDEEGHLLGIELLAPCTVKVLDSIADQEPEEVKRFLRRAAPREMVPA